MARCVKLFLAVLFLATIASLAHADCVAPVPPNAAGTTADYQRAVESFIQGGCFLTQWTADVAPRLTGSVANSITYSVHDQIRVFYSPAMLAWLQANRPDGKTVPSKVTPIPDGAAMVAGGIAAPPKIAMSNSSSTGPITCNARVNHGGDRTSSIGWSAVTGPSQINASLCHRHVGTPGPV